MYKQGSLKRNNTKGLLESQLERVYGGQVRNSMSFSFNFNTHFCILYNVVPLVSKK